LESARVCSFFCPEHLFETFGISENYHEMQRLPRLEGISIRGLEEAPLFVHSSLNRDKNVIFQEIDTTGRFFQTTYVFPQAFETTFVVRN